MHRRALRIAWAGAAAIDDPRLKGLRRRSRRAAEGFRQFHDLERARLVGEATDESAFFQRCDQPMDARFRSQVERLFHLVKRGRNTVSLDALVNEIEQIELLFR